MPTVEELVDLGRAAGLAAVGVVPAAIQQPARDVLHLRKAAGLAGDMQFTYRNPDRSTDPASILPSARSLVAGAWYYGHWQPSERPEGRPPGGRVARYAWHDHYRDLEQALDVMARPLRAAGHKAIVVADWNGLVDRNAAWSAGLGWYGKNANILLPGAGSWFVLGAVVTSAQLEPIGSPRQDGCGPCTRCLDDCPTGAIAAPGVVDATRCLAWLVQADGWFPRRWREALGDRIYGCDDCQEVCPPNRSGPAPVVLDRGRRGPPVADDRMVEVDLDWLLTAPDEEILARHGRWYVAGRDVDNIRRTALVVLGNVADPQRPEVVALLERYLAHPEPRLRGHAVWAARRLGLAGLVARLADDPDPDVRHEVTAPVESRPTGTGRSPAGEVEPGAEDA
jgi:epoxyqueuosine reductase